MRAAGRVAVLLGSCLLLIGCAGTQGPVEHVILTPPTVYIFGPDDRPDGKWRKHPTRTVALLLGRAKTTRILFEPRRAVLQVSCRRRKPEIRVAFDVGMRNGSITVSYRFDSKIPRQGSTRVRGQRRNIVVIDYPETAATFLSDLASSTELKVRVTREFAIYDAEFRWERGDRILKDVLMACSRPGPDRPQERDGPDDDEALDEAIKDVVPEDS